MLLGGWRWYCWVGLWYVPVSCQYKSPLYLVQFGHNLRFKFWVGLWVHSLGEGVVVGAWRCIPWIAWWWLSIDFPPSCHYCGQYICGLIANDWCRACSSLALLRCFTGRSSALNSVDSLHAFYLDLSFRQVSHILHCIFIYRSLSFNLFSIWCCDKSVLIKRLNVKEAYSSTGA